jgi:hypothetical protein
MFFFSCRWLVGAFRVTRLTIQSWTGFQGHPRVTPGSPSGSLLAVFAAAPPTGGAAAASLPCPPVTHGGRGRPAGAPGSARLPPRGATIDRHRCGGCWLFGFRWPAPGRSPRAPSSVAKGGASGNPSPPMGRWRRCRPRPALVTTRGLALTPTVDNPAASRCQPCFPGRGTVVTFAGAPDW